MNINYSMFYNCVCSGDGGAIYFSSSNSYLRMICANSCSGSHYHFAYLYASQVNQVEYLSVSNCSHTTSGSYSILIVYGDQRTDNTNSSMNNVEDNSGICIYSPSSFTSSHCTFSNNKVSDWICIHFYSSSGTISMSYANIVHNNSPSNGVVFVDGAGSRKMMYCIFKNNQNTLFCVNQGSLEVSHSFISHSGSFSIYTIVSTSNNNSFTNTITYQLQFFNSLHCNADIPLFTSPSTIEQTPLDSPQPTLEMTEINTPNLTPEKTGEQSLHPTNDQTLIETFLPTPISSLVPTVESTKSPSPIESPTSSFQNTILPTSDESSHHQFVQIAKYSSISLLVVIIIVILLYSGFKKKDRNENSIKEFTNTTQDSKIGNVYLKQLIEQ